MQYDVVVIGSGPGGYVGAIRCAQLGLKTAVIEKYKTFGGTCLNVGCIPSKALLDSSEHYHNAAHTFQTHGISLKDLKVDMPQMIARKNDVVAQNTAGIQYLFKKNKIDSFEGVGSFVDKNTIKITNNGKSETITAKHVIIATGSKPTTLPFLPIDKKRIITSTEALDINEVPKQMIVIGGGVIGLELGSVYARLGTKVSVIEFMPSLLGAMDAGLGKELQRVLKKSLGMEFFMNHKVTGATVEGEKVTVTATNAKGEELKFDAEYCIVAVGRTAYTAGLDLENIGLKTEERGNKIPVNDHLETAVPGVYAIGDVVKGAMLAHKAEDEGIYVAERIAGQKPHINYNLIPGVVYTWPEVASVGFTEEQLKEKGQQYKTGSFPFKASGRAKASMDTDGFVKVLADAKTDEILGVHMIGPRAADMIAEAVVAMEFRASAEDIARICHAHPTYTEAFKEAAMGATENRAIHI